MSPQAEAAPLGRLLLFESALYAAVDEAALCDLVETALVAMPGVRAARLELVGSECAPRQSAQTEPFPEASTTRSLPVRTIDRTYGRLELLVDDAVAYAPYAPFISNVANHIALWVESQRQRRERAALLQHMDVLVRTRTADLEREKERAEEASHAKDEFFALLGHELRNPLAPIVAALELVMSGGRPSRELAIVDRQVRELVRLVDDLLDVSRVTRGLITLVREPVDLHPVIERALETAAPLLRERNHSVAVDVPAGELIVEADAARLAQVVTNLLTNAAKYTSAGGRIEVVAVREAQLATVRVTDTGIGMEPATLAHLFEPFVRSAGARARAKGGLGLGLALARSIVELHGGSIAAESRGLAHGSTFHFSLPLADVTLPREASPLAHERASSSPRLLGSWRVLVVDDNADAANMLAMGLRRCGAEVRVAYSGEEALELLDGYAATVGVFDIAMPGISGLDLAQRVRERKGKGIRLLALTGYGQAYDRQRSAAAGFDAHLVKPVSLSQLTEALEARV